MKLQSAKLLPNKPLPRIGLLIRLSSTCSSLQALRQGKLSGTRDIEPKEMEAPNKSPRALRAVIVARTYAVLPLNDALTRSRTPMSGGHWHWGGRERPPGLLSEWSLACAQSKASDKGGCIWPQRIKIWLCTGFLFCGVGGGADRTSPPLFCGWISTAT